MASHSNKLLLLLENFQNFTMLAEVQGVFIQSIIKILRIIEAIDKKDTFTILICSSKLRITTHLKFLHSKEIGAVELLSIKTKGLFFDSNKKKFLSCKKREEKKLCFYRNVIQKFDFCKFYGRNSFYIHILRTMIQTVRKYL